MDDTAAMHAFSCSSARRSSRIGTSAIISTMRKRDLGKTKSHLRMAGESQLLGQQDVNTCRDVCG